MVAGCPLDPGTVVAVDLEPLLYRQLRDVWHDQSVVRELDDAVHQLELIRATVPPVIEVTVTAPPGGISREELGPVVRDAVARFTGPQLAVQMDQAAPVSRARRVKDYLLGDPPPGPAALPPGMTGEEFGSDYPTNPDPTGPIPVIQEVRVP